ncbi:response regulator transcription factor [Variovorax sp. J22P168]|uniref:response regulator transcription factor n=1 Tax=Variovorax jilinensis TaxID=3053513 RepID=UPI002578D847|nr:response regulator transcription factor [Variovorax sp. J22P168]MDM0015933.1 response regulator transcription factor [Variovorax sp. J22P168]
MNNVPPIEVYVCHSSPLVSAGLAATLHGQVGLSVSVREVDHGLPDDLRCDVLIADYATGLRCVGAMSAAQSDTRGSLPRLLIVTSKAGEWDIRCAMAQGVPGYLLLGCPAERLVHAVRSLARGGRCYDDTVSARLAESLIHATLTKREQDVLKLLSQGVGNKLIARSLDIQLGTVKTHVKAILAKLEVRTRTQAVVVAEHRGLTGVVCD